MRLTYDRKRMARYEYDSSDCIGDFLDQSLNVLNNRHKAAGCW
jgi:hypothetical protein